MTEIDRPPGRLLAISDLHVSYPENRAVVDRLRPTDDADWLLVAGDVAERLADVEWALGALAGRFAQVVWAPGNHELWTPRDEPDGLRGVARYEELVRIARRLGVATPEDPYPVYRGSGGPVTVAPLFVLYDYSFLPAGSTSAADGLARAYAAGVVCTDELLLHPDPYPDRASWCAARVGYTQRRLAGRAAALPTVLVNHFPLTRHPTEILRYPEFALWCGTTRTADWHRRYRAAAVVYGHLHIPRVTVQDGVRFEEVSLGYPREWSARAGLSTVDVDRMGRLGIRPAPPGELRQILPVPAGATDRVAAGEPGGQA